MYMYAKSNLLQVHMYTCIYMYMCIFRVQHNS